MCVCVFFIPASIYSESTENQRNIYAKLTHLCSGLSYLNFFGLVWSISNRRGDRAVFTIIIEIPILNANSVDSDLSARFAASDLGPH